MTFYHHVQDNYTTFPTEVYNFDEIKKLYETVSYNKELTLNEKVEFKYNLNHTYTSSSFEDKEVDILFKNRTNEEYIDNRLASFFVIAILLWRIFSGEAPKNMQACAFARTIGLE